VRADIWRRNAVTRLHDNLLPSNRRIDALGIDIAHLDAKVEALIASFAQAVDRLDEILGVGRRAAQELIAEIGDTMTVVPTAAHLASWANSPHR
jgi:transposase